MVGFFHHMEIDAGSDVILVRRNFLQRRGKQKMRKSDHQLKQFDITVIKLMGTFEGTFETKKRFEMVPITVVACNKDHGLLRIDVLKVDATKLINSIKAGENNIGLLRDYRLSVLLKESHYSSYVESLKLLIHVLPIVVAK